ncbi:hypothetical protein ACOM2C_07215 [Pseudarthrobacter sp. So.54]
MDWNPPPDQEHDTDVDWDPPPDERQGWDLDAELDSGLPPDPGPDPDQELPVDPLPAKYQPAA